MRKIENKKEGKMSAVKRDVSHLFIFTDFFFEILKFFVLNTELFLMSNFLKS